MKRALMEPVPGPVFWGTVAILAWVGMDQPGIFLFFLAALGLMVWVFLAFKRLIEEMSPERPRAPREDDDDG